MQDSFPDHPNTNRKLLKWIAFVVFVIGFFLVTYKLTSPAKDRVFAFNTPRGWTLTGHTFNSSGVDAGWFYEGSSGTRLSVSCTTQNIQVLYESTFFPTVDETMVVLNREWQYRARKIKRIYFGEKDEAAERSQTYARILTPVSLILVGVSHSAKTGQDRVKELDDFVEAAIDANPNDGLRKGLL